MTPPFESPRIKAPKMAHTQIIVSMVSIDRQQPVSANTYCKENYRLRIVPERIPLKLQTPDN
jgi:hypothetical protein